MEFAANKKIFADPGSSKYAIFTWVVRMVFGWNFKNCWSWFVMGIHQVTNHLRYLCGSREDHVNCHVTCHVTYVLVDEDDGYVCSGQECFERFFDVTYGRL